MRIKKMSIKYSYILITLFIIIPMLSFIAFNYYELKKTHIIDEAYKNLELSENTIVNTIENTEKNYELVARYYEPLMQEALVEFQEAYENIDMNAEKVNLEDLKSTYSNLMDFYIIDENGIIIYSTLKAALGIDFSEFTDFFHRLTDIRLNDSITISKVTTDLVTKELRKWGYLSSSDHKYVLEVGINSSELNKYIEKLDYRSIEEDILKNNSFIKSVNVYDQRHYNLGYNKVAKDGRLVSIIDKVFQNRSNKTIFDKNGHPSIKYILVDSLPYLLDDAQKVIEIKYDFSSVILELKKIKKSALIKISLYIVFSILFIYFITTRFITKPIITLSRIVNEITPTNLNFDYVYNSDNEIGILVKSFRKMTNVLDSTLVSNDYLKTVLDSFGDFLAILDTDFYILRVNDTLLEYLKCDPNKIIGKSIEDLFLDSIDKVYYKEILENHGIIQNIEQVIMNDEGEHVLVLTTISVIENKSQDIVGYILNSTNITNIKENLIKIEALNKKLKTREKLLLEETSKDFLTKAYNRSFSMKKLRDLSANKVPYSIIMCDIDFFKKINDTYGHVVGDKVLIESVKVMKSVVSNNDYVCRYGGEEFLIIVTDNNSKTVVSMAKKLRIAIENHKFTDGIRITISCGVGVNNLKDHSSEGLIKSADENLYKAKNNGRNRVEF
ncbi:hypothetical protein SH2C18_19150 [Clostridium sediminicola]|uniref:sensor domain-containing diguanylate cyclase n=1 Tax=Clostridium sediminicola TaxID=3114879 RepID=UPI0031F23EB1